MGFLVLFVFVGCLLLGGRGVGFRDCGGWVECVVGIRLAAVAAFLGNHYSSMKWDGWWKVGKG